MKLVTHALSAAFSIFFSESGVPMVRGNAIEKSDRGAFINFRNEVYISILQIVCMKHLDKPLFHYFLFVNIFIALGREKKYLEKLWE